MLKIQSCDKNHENPGSINRKEVRAGSPDGRIQSMSTAAILFSNLNDRTLSRLTQDRTVAAIPFACRYRLIDFALSEMVNADISRTHYAS